MGKYINNLTILDFNPLSKEKLDFNPLSKEKSISINSIFQDKIARTLWIGIKQKHLTDQYFNQHCLDASKIIKEEGAPNTLKKLESFIVKHFGIPCNQEFIEEFFPYVSNLKTLKYEIVYK